MVPVLANTEQMRARAATGLSVQESAQSGSASEPRAATAVEWVARAGVVIETLAIVHLAVYRRWLLRVLLVRSLGVMEALSWLLMLPYLVSFAIGQRHVRNAYVTLSIVAGVGVGSSIFLAVLFGAIISLLSERCEGNNTPDCCGACLDQVLVGTIIQVVLFIERFAICSLCCKLQRSLSPFDDLVPTLAADRLVRPRLITAARSFSASIRDPHNRQHGSESDVAEMNEISAVFVLQPTGDIESLGLEQSDSFCTSKASDECEGVIAVADCVVDERKHDECHTRDRPDEHHTQHSSDAGEHDNRGQAPRNDVLLCQANTMSIELQESSGVQRDDTWRSERRRDERNV